MRSESMVRWWVSRAFFPLLFCTILGAATVSLNRGMDPHLAMVVFMAGSIIVVAITERLLTYEPSWNRSQGDVGPDVMHLLVSNVGMSAVSDVAVIPFGFALAAAVQNL